MKAYVDQITITEHVVNVPEDLMTRFLKSRVNYWNFSKVVDQKGQNEAELDRQSQILIEEEKEVKEEFAIAAGIPVEQVHEIMWDDEELTEEQQELVKQYRKDTDIYETIEVK